MSMNNIICITLNFFSKAIKGFKYKITVDMTSINKTIYDILTISSNFMYVLTNAIYSCYFNRICEVVSF